MSERRPPRVPVAPSADSPPAAPVRGGARPLAPTVRTRRSADGTDVLEISDAEDGDPVELKKWRAGANDAPEPGRASTRVDATPTLAPAAALDIDELRLTLEEAAKLLRTVKHQASSLDLDLVAPAARGMNAQLTAALHRLAEALAMLQR